MYNREWLLVTLTVMALMLWLVLATTGCVRCQQAGPDGAQDTPETGSCTEGEAPL